MVNKDIFQGQWRIIKGQIKQKFGRLTDDDLAEIDGRREELIGRLQQRYGYAKEKAEHELTNFEKTLKSNTSGVNSSYGNVNKPNGSGNGYSSPQDKPRRETTRQY